jgi:serine/threonine-protein kinase
MRRAAPPAPPAPAPVSQPAAAEAPPRKGGLPIALLGGLAVLLVLAAGGAWFLLQPGAPKPAPVAAATLVPKPVVPTPPAAVPPLAPPTPSPEQRLAKVTAAIAQTPCANLSAALADGGGITVSGLAGGGGPEHDARTAAEQAAGAPVAWPVRGVPTIYCGALDALRTATASGGEVLPLSMNGASGSVHLVDRAFIVPRVGLPGFPSWLTVDYLANDGTSFHMYPPHRPLAPLKPGSALTLTAKETGTYEPSRVGSPFGTDLIIAVASSKQLLAWPRPASETTAAYLAALTSALASARAEGTATAAGALLVETSER